MTDDSTDVYTLVFEAIRAANRGAKLRIELRHSLMFDDHGPDNGNACRALVTVVLPQENYDAIDPPGAQAMADEFFILGDLRSLLRTLGHWNHDSNFRIESSDRSFELSAESASVSGIRCIEVLGQMARPPIQRTSWRDHWKWAIGAPKHESIYQCKFAFFADPGCIGAAAAELERFLHSLSK